MTKRKKRALNTRTRPDLDRLRNELIRDEGYELFPYTDTVGKMTIGVGRNLTDRGITKDEAGVLLMNDITGTIAALMLALPWFPRLDPMRQRVLINMGFNLGVAGLLKFTNTLAAVERGDYDAAADGMLASKWATQTGARAVRLAAMMRTGSVPKNEGVIKV